MSATTCHQEWFNPNRRNSLLLIVALATLAGCRDANDTPLAPDGGLAPVYAVLDGANGGNPHFFFLPPNVPPPSFSGTFDPNQSPEARICLLISGACSGPDVATFTLSSVPNNITVDVPAEAYRFRWKTKDANVTDGEVYRARVFLGPVLLGFLDIEVVASQQDLASVPAGFAGVVVNKNLQIFFRIELGAVPTPILFESDRTGDFEIYVLDADGVVHNVSNSPGTPDRNGVWSPDGTQLLFVREVTSSNFEIYKVNADGTGLTNLTNNPARDLFPDWSPDGTQIVFHTDRDPGFFEIYKMNTIGGALVRLTNNTFPDLLAHWSPDGTKIAFERVFPVIVPQGQNREIHVMNADGTGQTNITNNAALNDGFGTWSPNGTQIAFFTDRDGNLEVYKMNADGTGVTNLSNNGATDGGVVDWSPDGTTITWTGTHVPGNPEIFAVPAGGGTPVNLTNSAGVDNASLWSPDGSRIIFVSSRDLNFEVYVMQANGSFQARVTNNAGQDLRPVWRQ